MIEYTIRLKRKSKNIFGDGWVWRMALRDARHNGSRLALFMASLVAGIMAMVALDSLNNGLQKDIDRNAKELLGADMLVNASRPFEPELISLFDSIPHPQADEADMASMVLFVNSGNSRLIRLVALRGAFPFYGKIETLPADAYEKMKTGGHALLDETLASQYEVSSGDTIKIGNYRFPVAGVVTKIPGGGGILATFTPSVYIAWADLDSTRLVQYGSRVNYRKYIKTASDAQAVELAGKLKPLARKYGHGFDDVEERKRELGEAFQSVYRFFSLLAFIALILGCIGIASSVHLYSREKRAEVAVLRCVGSSGWQAFNIFFIQIFFLSILGSFVGSLLGIGIHQLLPILFGNLVPVEINLSVSWLSVIKGMLLGTLMGTLFSMLPLLSIRFVPPLTVLRGEFEAGKIFSKAKVAALAGVVLFPVAFAVWQTGETVTGFFFVTGFLVALGMLALVALLLLRAVQKFFPVRASFVWRHALANLFRPNNQSRVLMVTIGLGAFLVATLNIIEKSLLSQVEFSGRENQSNTILFDIQPSQKEGVIALIKANDLPVNQVVPIVTCRLAEVKGKPIDLLQRDTTDGIPNWALTREYRVTYRDSLHHSEELIKGELQRKTSGRDSVWVTISEGMHENLEVAVGDSLVFDVQGVPVKVRISGIRKVDWPKDPPNFIFVFPAGVLEEAPQVFVTSTRITDQQRANQFQQRLVNEYPNISLIDLRLILSTVNELFDKLGAVIRFMALFSIITGLVVLAGSVTNSKFIRIRENVLLRTLGARTGQINLITLIEYGYVGLFSALTGMILSLGGGYLLTTFFFKITFAFSWPELVTTIAGVVFLTMLIGWWNSREVIATPPLQVLRKEG
ncbi:MAG: ABC transporter permease [Flammeovirgaceae bacterium]|nr:MAG: ABC transporter permease [Flammeovirgaceae bacterium]